MAGRPLSGIKTIPHEIAHHVASQANQTVCLFDSNEDASISALHILGKLAGYRMPYRWLEEKNPDRLEDAKVVLDMLPIFVASKAGMKIGWLKKRLEQVWKEDGLTPALVIVNSIQGLDETESRENGFDKVMRQLKKLPFAIKLR